MRLIMVRHGETDWNVEHRVQGQADIPLNESGRRQAELAALALHHESVEAIYSSPLQRTLATAGAINRFHGLPIQTLAGLKELNTGELSGLLASDIALKYPDFYQIWTTDAAHARMPSGESLPELQKRAWDSIQGIVNHDGHHKVVVVSHFFVIASLSCRALDLSLSEFRRFAIRVGSISTIDFSADKTELVSINDTAHLE